MLSAPAGAALLLSLLPAWAGDQPDLFVPARVQTVDIGGGLELRVVTPLAAVERPTWVTASIAVSARPSFDVGARRSVEVEVCAGQRCAVRRTLNLEIGGATVETPALMTASGLVLQVKRPSGSSHACCGNGRPAHVVASTAAPRAVVGPPLLVTTDGTEYGGSQTGGLHLVHAAGLLAAEPELLHSFGAVIIADDDALDMERVLDFVARGGVLSLPSAGAPAALDFTPLAGVRRLGWGSQLADIAVPDGTRVARHGAGLVVARPPGATEQEQIAGLVVAEPALLVWLDPGSPEYGSGVAAAGVALAVKPPRGAAFAIALIGVLGLAVVVRRLRARSWQSAVAAGALMASGVTGALWALEVATVPSVTRARVTTWTGAGASWETSVDAARPRARSTVEVGGGQARIETVSVLGDDDDVGIIRLTDDERRAEARVGSAAALVAITSRPSPHPRAVLVDGGVLANDLDVALRAVAIEGGARALYDVAPGARVKIDEVARNRWEPARPRLAPEEERLLGDVLSSCMRRLAVTLTPERSRQCGAAVAHLADGTMLGIEISP